MIERFVVSSPLLGGMSLDYDEIMLLSHTDFAQLYLEMMNAYQKKDSWFIPGQANSVPSCSECHAQISGPEQLRRYKGLSMHPACFKTFYAREGDDKGIIKKYWNRVASLP